MPLSFSLITPSFQQGRYLRACVDSVLEQGYPAFDYAVFDGGSTDESASILKEYGDRFFWRSAPDGGQVHAVNEGLRRATGDLVGYLNSDDRLLPGALDRVAGFFAAHPEVEVVYGRGIMIDEAGRSLREFPTAPWDFGAMIDHCFICQPAAFWRRSLHERFGVFDPAFPNTFDYEFWIRLGKAGVRFAYFDEPLACARDHAEAKSRRRLDEIFPEIRRLQIKHLGYCSRSWWEQHLRHLRNAGRGAWRWLPGRDEQRLHGLAWLPYVLWRRFLPRMGEDKELLAADDRG